MTTATQPLPLSRAHITRPARRVPGPAGRRPRRRLARLVRTLWSQGRANLIERRLEHEHDKRLPLLLDARR